MLELSHVLYKVEDLHSAVEKLRNAGFIVEYGTRPSRAYNAFIWFEKGVFVELYTHSGLSGSLKWLIRNLGYASVLDRIDKWDKIKNGWCEWSLETSQNSLYDQKKILRNKGISFKSHQGRRIDLNLRKLKWQLIFPDDILFPFMMSAYNINPRPQKIEHPNGSTGVSLLTVGRENLNISLLDHLLPDQKGLQLLEGKQGLQTVTFAHSNLKIEDILI